jgi:hypothetical protein
VTLNHHQHDLTDVVTPSDRRSVEDDSDGIIRTSTTRGVSQTETNRARQLSSFTSTTQRAGDHPPSVSAPQRTALYAVPSKPSHHVAGARASASDDAAADQGAKIGQRHVQKSAKARRSEGGIRIGQLRTAAASSNSNRPRIPIEYMSTNGPPTSGDDDRQETEDDLGFDDVITMATANGYVDNGQRESGNLRSKNGRANQPVETILPPPDVFSDVQSDAFSDSEVDAATAMPHDPGESKPRGRSTSWSTIQHHRQAMNESIYSEVTDESRSHAAIGSIKDPKMLTTNLETKNSQSRDVSSSQMNGKLATNGGNTVVRFQFVIPPQMHFN